MLSEFAVPSGGDVEAPAGAFERGIAYICDAQAGDGHWNDFELPVGASDAWITAFIGAQLAECPSLDARAAAEAAADWLLAYARDGAWGFNGAVPADADSTAWTTILLSRLGRDLRVVNLDFLRAHFRDGGVATYLDGDGWARPHACVTAAAILAFRVLGAHSLARHARDWLRAVRPAGSAWSGYWWSSSFYPTMMGLGALDHLVEAERSILCDAAELAVVHSIVDLACAARIARLTAEAGVAAEFDAALCAWQDADGAWPPSPCLRVTHHFETSIHATSRRGMIYADHRRLFGTALSVSALNTARTDP